MEFIIPDWIVNSTGLNLDAALTGNKLKLTILAKNPTFSTDGSPGTESVGHITSIALLSDLLADPAWEDISGPSWYRDHDWGDPAQATNDVTVSDRDFGGAPVIGETRNVIVTDGRFLYWPDPDGSAGIATGFVLSIVGGTHDGKIVMIFRPDVPIYLPGTDQFTCTRIGAETAFFSYLEDNGTDNTDGWHIQIGDVGITVPTVNWETSRCVHVWIDPQRINYVANPSFRNTNNFGWRSNGTATRITGGLSRDGANNCIKILQIGSDPVVLESNFFPTNSDTQNWYVSAEVSGVGRWRVGIVFFSATVDPNNATYVVTPWRHSDIGSTRASDFYRMHQSFPKPESTKEGLVRIEFLPDVDGTPGWVDEVLAAPEDGPGTYFDASFPTGSPGDFGWYGNDRSSSTTVFNDRSYSLFYDNWKNLKSLMFGERTTGPDGVLNRQAGEAQHWVPEGVNIVPHWNDVFSTRVQSWMDDVTIPVKDFTNKTVVTDLP